MWLSLLVFRVALRRNPLALGAFSFHTYDHNCPTCASVSAVAKMQNGGIDASRHAFAAAAAIHASANTSSALWITETAFSVDSPIGAGGGGAKATVNGMCRAADIAWCGKPALLSLKFCSIVPFPSLSWPMIVFIRHLSTSTKRISFPPQES